MQLMAPANDEDTRLFRFPLVRVVSFNVWKQMSYKPSLEQHACVPNSTS